MLVHEDNQLFLVRSCYSLFVRHSLVRNVPISLEVYLLVPHLDVLGTTSVRSARTLKFDMSRYRFVLLVQLNLTKAA